MADIFSLFMQPMELPPETETKKRKNSDGGEHSARKKLKTKNSVGSEHSARKKAKIIEDSSSKAATPKPNGSAKKEPLQVSAASANLMASFLGLKK